MTNTSASLASHCRAALRAARRRLTAQAGVALPMAIVTLAIVTSLAGVAVVAATEGNDSSNLDSNTKAAQEAAETGLNVATYRLTMLQPTTGYCFTGNVVSGGTSGWCQDSSGAESLGNGSSFTYWDSTDGVSSCVGYTVVNQDGLTQRCITAQGTANGVTVREQARVAEYSATPLFPYAGVIGLNTVVLSGGAKVGGVVATNGVLNLSGGSSATSGELGPSGSEIISSATIGTVAKRTTAQGPIVLSPVDPGNSNSVNSNQRITNGTLTPKVTPYDSSSGNIGWTASKRTLNMSGGAQLTLGGGVYNFCSLQISGGSTLTIAAGVTAQIFIDSANRSGSGCGSNSDYFNVSGGGSIVNPSDQPNNLQIYVYDGSGGTAQLSGGSAFYGVLYAPLSAVGVSGGAGVYGGIAGLSVNMSGGSFTWESSVSTLSAGTSGLYYRTAWEQCQAPNTSTLNTSSGGC